MRRARWRGRAPGGFGDSAIRGSKTHDEGQRRNAGPRQAAALSFLGGGEAPPGLAAGDGRDERGFVAILRIFIRTWPYLLPHTVGYWREFPRRSARRGSETGADAGWSSRHVPPLVTVLAALGPLSGLVPVGWDWPSCLLLTATASMAALSWTLPFAKGRRHALASRWLALLAAAAFSHAVFWVDGFADNAYVVVVSAGCVCTWVFQYRIEAGRFRFRIRLGSHLAYYFALLWASTLLTMAIALFSVDLVSQSILQAQPLTPFLADFIGQPELARGEGGEPGAQATSADAEAGEANIDLAPLTAAERQSLAWVYAGFMIFGWLAQIPATMFLPYYYIFIMQRVNQGLRQALLMRWHRLSLRYHSGHRVGDSVYRIYQDSAQVTAVIGTVAQAMHLVVAYATGVVFLVALDPALGAMALSVLLLAVLWGFWYSPRMRARSLVAREANSAFTSRLQETFAAVRLIKAHGTGEAEQERLDRVFDILDIEPDVKNSPDARPMPPFAREIRFHRVGFSYEPDRPVLKNVSFTAQAGTVTAIVGPTGSGKSSLTSLLFRLFDPDSGAISIDGTDIRRLELESLRDNVAVALQENVLFGGSLRDNVRYAAPEASDERVLAAARVACLDEAIAKLPAGLDTVLDDRGGKLSTGQRQRLSIARAVVKDAPILVLDEPTAALDAHTEHRVLQRLAAWGEGRAIFLITHRISTIRQAHRILYLDDGRIAENGAHEELMRMEGGRYRRFVAAEEALSRRAGQGAQTAGGVA